METVIAQVATPKLIRHNNDNNHDERAFRTNPLTVWSWERLSFRDYPPQRRSTAEGESDAAYQVRAKSIGDRSCRARCRSSAISRLLWSRHGGPCNTDDAEDWIAAALPFIVDAAELSGHSAFIEGLAWVRKHCPAYVNNEGGYDRVAEAIQDLLDHRDAAEDQRREMNSEWVWWTPTMPGLKRLLRPTWEEITSLDLKGWACIDRPSDEDLKARATAKRRESRRALGAQPQSERTKTADLAAIAAEVGKSLRTLERWSAAGTLDAKLAQLRMSEIRPSHERAYGNDTFPTRGTADNDNNTSLIPCAA